MLRCRFFTAAVWALTTLCNLAQPVPDRTDALLGILGSDAGLEAKMSACRDLAAIGDDRAVPTLAGLLADPDLSHMARYALEPMPAGAADTALRQALATLEGEARVGVIHTIGARRDRGSVAALNRLCAGEDAAAAAAAMQALGRVASPEAIACLQTRLDGADDPSRVILADACLAAAAALAEDGNTAAAMQVFDRLRREALPVHQTIAATRGAIITRGNAGVPLLIDVLTHTEPARRRLGLALARDLPGPRVTTALGDALPDLSPALQAPLVHALADRGDAAAVPACAKAVHSPTPVLRLAAIAALGRLGSAAAVSPLVAAATTPGKPDEAEAARAALRAVRAPGVADAIAQALSRLADPALRTQLIKLLADRGAGESVPQLLRAAVDPDATVGTAALDALATVAGPDQVAQLVDVLLASPDRGHQDAAVKAIGAAAARDPDRANRGRPVRGRLSAETDRGRRVLLLRALAGLGTFEAIDALRGALHDQDAAVRDAAVRLLADWKDATPTAVLLGVADTTDNPIHRVVALRAVLHMAALVAADCETPSAQILEWYRHVDRIVRGPSEVKLLLSGLTQLGHPAALQMAHARLADRDVQAEAALAVIATAPAAAAYGARELAREALEQVVATVDDDKVRQRAETALKTLGGAVEHILDWQVTGPHVQAGKECRQLYPIPFPPEADQDAAEWQVLPRTAAGGSTLVNVGTAFPGSHRAAYARTWLISPRTQPAVLAFGFDDGGKAWLNGDVVCEANTAGACVPDQHKATVTLREGANLLFLKLTQHTGPWQFCARLTGPDGEPLNGIVASLGDLTRSATHGMGEPPPGADPLAGIPAVPLFDGRTLSGWEGAPGCFQARDGAIVGGQLDTPISISDYLCTTRYFGDFELTAEVRTRGKGTNGGIQFRGERIPNSHAMTGFQADVRDGAYWGCLYDCARHGFAVRIPQQELRHILRLDDWNEVRVRAVGNRIRIWLNGYRTVDYAETDPAIPRRGRIGIQTHKGPPGEGWYRNIMIRAAP